MISLLEKHTKIDNDPVKLVVDGDVAAIGSASEVEHVQIAEKFSLGEPLDDRLIRRIVDFAGYLHEVIATGPLCVSGSASTCRPRVDWDVGREHAAKAVQIIMEREVVVRR